MGLLLALLGTFYQGKTYGTGYHEAAQALHGIYEAPSDSPPPNGSPPYSAIGQASRAAFSLPR